MRNLLLAALLTTLALPAAAQGTADIAARLQRLEDKAALKELVDTFSNLADQKDAKSQVLLFTEDATLEIYSNGKLGTTYKGRKQIGDAFAGTLARFESVYHINGQQTVDLRGDTATGTAYCFVLLIGTEKGKKIKSTLAVYYHDQFVRQANRWLIARRQAHFVVRDREEMASPQ